MPDTLHRLILATTIAAWAWILTLSLYITVALLTAHPLNPWLILAAEPATIAVWVLAYRGLR